VGKELLSGEIEIILYAITIGSIMVGQELEEKFINELSKKQE